MTDVDGQIAESLRRVFNLTESEARHAAAGRGGSSAAGGFAGVTRMFRGVFGLSEQAAEAAAGGRDGDPSWPVSEASSSWLKPGDNERLIGIIEGWAQDLLAHGQLCVERGETREQAALKEAYGKVFLNAQNDLQKLWIMTVVRSWRPELLAESGSGSSGQSPKRSTSESSSRRAGGKQPGSKSVTVAESVTDPAVLRRSR
jgi:hypothetical protein